jgi:RND family efflux transporter MFP subunit
MRKLAILVFGFSIAFVPPAFAAELEQDHKEANQEDEDSGSVKLAPESMKIAEIVVEALTALEMGSEIRAPGEIKLNTYLSSKVTPRITAQIVERHASLGDVVTKGQPLVTLSSVELARTVGDLLVAEKEWVRMKQLGLSVISIKQYSEAQIAREQALAIAKAYGVSPDHLNVIMKTGIDKNPGQFSLLSPQNGVVVSDEFISGELIEPGRVIFDIVDETVLWVESSLSPEIANDVIVGAPARVRGSDGNWLPARVTQKHHMLDEETRTIGIRMEVQNDGHRLHAGTFVDTRIQSGVEQSQLAVPTEAVLQSPDGDWMVFVEETPGQFRPEEVEIVRAIGDYTVIAGIPEGTRIVTQGAFFVQSELAKSGFEVHNH